MTNIVMGGTKIMDYNLLDKDILYTLEFLWWMIDEQRQKGFFTIYVRSGDFKTDAQDLLLYLKKRKVYIRVL